MKIELTGCSETSAQKMQMLANHPKEIVHHLQHGENLKSSALCFIVVVAFCQTKFKG